MKKIIKYLIIMLVLVNINGCVIASPKSDYDMKLAGNYELWKVNKYSISIGILNNNGSLTPQIYGQVIELDFNDEYIIARSIPTYKVDEQNFSNFSEKEKYIESIPEEDYEFWIIQVENEMVYGPLNEDEFNKKRKETSVPESMKLKELDSYKKYFEYVE